MPISDIFINPKSFDAFEFKTASQLNAFVSVQKFRSMRPLFSQSCLNKKIETNRPIIFNMEKPYK